ncbi:hypothetical protein [Novosphingobium panipatense]|uniref:Uncharacterized protein n=1 Tax=Novosphingobium panipatense TaxID=428991 RepID=A0ABY1QPB3_9SPHN|nr:hypothetical protein [Novosphingobium panipatense]SMP74859.1 hypothetical protein SAMN06296065_107185 [Novosphingobium panipatense]
MAVIGCLLLIVLPLLGLILGGLLWGTEGMRWGAGIGFVLALAVLGGSTYALVRATRRK